ncbi:MAG: LCP family protein [Caldilineaceae bacterium]
MQQLDPELFNEYSPNLHSTAHITRSQQRRALLIGITYTCLMIFVVGLGSNLLYNWARQRIIQSSPLSAIQEVTLADSPVVTADGEPAVVVDVAGQPAAVEEPSRATVAGQRPVNVLLLGTDARPEDTEAARTDTIILLTLDPQSKTGGMLSLPRDLWLPIPNQNVTTKINMAYVIGENRNYAGGGAQLAMDTVSSFIGHPVDYYVRVNFHGFTQIVDLIGGIDIMVPHTIHDDHYPTPDYGTEVFHVDAGLQHMDGETALKYVRTRNTDDDYGRARRQQLVIQAIADKVLRADMIPALLPKIPTLFYTMRSSIDTNIPMATQIEMAQYLRTATPQNMRTLVLDSDYGEETYSEEGAWILLPDRDRVRAALERFFAPAPDVAAGNADPSWVRVEVLNGTGQPGVAARTRTLLQSYGWQVVSIDDADRSDYTNTLIINYRAPDELVEKLSQELDVTPGSAELSADKVNAIGTSPVDLRIVLGRDILPKLRE